jgi:dipeptidyl aminopeptidase/acylaminoacyl peptidase
LETADLFRVRWPSQPRISPAGDLVAMTVTWLDPDRDRTASEVIWTSTDGRGSVDRAAGDPDDDRDPAWAPDGRRLAIVSRRSGGPEVWVIDLAERSIERITDVAGEVSGPTWSPDGATIAFVGADPPDPGIGRAPRRQVWIASADGRHPRRLTDGHSDDDLPCWSPAGDRIAYRSARGSAGSELWTIGTTAGEPQQLVPAVGPILALAWAPDGASIAYLGHDHGAAQGMDAGLWLVDVATGARRLLTASLDRPVGQAVRADPPGAFAPPDLAWAASGDACFVVYADGGTSHLARIGLDGDVERILPHDHSWFGLSVAAGSGSVAALGATPTDPGELIVAGPRGEEPRTILAIAQEWRQTIAFGRLERLSFAAADGTPLEAWLQHPAGSAPDERLPVILHIHGGPHWPIGERFVFEHRRLAEQGYRVLSMNPRGATGYGTAYAQGNVGDWGGVDASDLLSALDVACARPDVDASRQAVTGESYGGYMTNWLIATTTRFRAAVAQNSISDLRSAYLRSEDPTSYDWEMGGSPSEQPVLYAERSPLTHVAAIRTPLLLIHSELDTNCPIDQAEQLEAALRSLGRRVELVRIPGEGHLINLIGRPSSRLTRIAVTDRFLAEMLGSAMPDVA